MPSDKKVNPNQAVMPFFAKEGGLVENRGNVIFPRSETVNAKGRVTVTYKQGKKSDIAALLNLKGKQNAQNLALALRDAARSGALKGKELVAGLPVEWEFKRSTLKDLKDGQDLAVVFHLPAVPVDDTQQQVDAAKLEAYTIAAKACGLTVEEMIKKVEAMAAKEAPIETTVTSTPADQPQLGDSQPGTEPGKAEPSEAEIMAALEAEAKAAQAAAQADNPTQ